MFSLWQHKRIKAALAVTAPPPPWVSASRSTFSRRVFFFKEISIKLLLNRFGYTTARTPEGQVRD
jgi:hypothetical protein